MSSDFTRNRFKYCFFIGILNIHSFKGSPPCLGVTLFYSPWWMLSGSLVPIISWKTEKSRSRWILTGSWLNISTGLNELSEDASLLFNHSSFSPKLNVWKIVYCNAKGLILKQPRWCLLLRVPMSECRPIFKWFYENNGNRMEFINLHDNLNNQIFRRINQ